MSKVAAYYHIVFCTKSREMTIPLDMREHLYRFIWSEIRKLNCSLSRIGGIQNHVHMLINLHPSASLSTLMQNIKSRSSGWMKSDARFPDFRGWAEDYFASSVSPEQKHSVIEYIKNQEQHHLGTGLDDEFCRLYNSAELSLHPNDLR